MIMLSITGLSEIIGYIIILGVTMVSVIAILRNKSAYGTELNMYLNLASILNGGIIFSTLFLLSTLFYINKEFV